MSGNSNPRHADDALILGETDKAIFFITFQIKCRGKKVIDRIMHHVCNQFAESLRMLGCLIKGKTTIS